MTKQFMKPDERENRIVGRISSILYFVTLFSLIGIQLYRQFVLDQAMEEWNDIAILIAFNAIVWVGSLMYVSGTFNPRVVRARYLIIGFAGFVVLGLAFTLFKYAVLLDQTLNMSMIVDSGVTVLIVSSILTGFWGILGYLGNKRIENQIQ
jgi:hypothetical protein